MRGFLSDLESEILLVTGISCNFTSKLSGYIKHFTTTEACKLDTHTIAYVSQMATNTIIIIIINIYIAQINML
jgi:hypothetical protein